MRAVLTECKVSPKNVCLTWDEYRSDTRGYQYKWFISRENALVWAKAHGMDVIDETSEFGVSLRNAIELALETQREGLEVSEFEAGTVRQQNRVRTISDRAPEQGPTVKVILAPVSDRGGKEGSSKNERADREAERIGRAKYLEARDALEIRASQVVKNGHVSPEMQSNWRASMLRWYDDGHEPYDGSPAGVSAYSGIPATTIDHAPSREYVSKKGDNYGGHRWLIACDLKENLHKGIFGGDCVLQIAMRISYYAQKHAKRNGLDAKRREIILGVGQTWPEPPNEPPYPCQCRFCKAMPYTERYEMVWNDPRTWEAAKRSAK